MVVYKLRGPNLIELKVTAKFREWLSKQKDKRLRLRIASRLDRLSYGNPGDVKPVGEGTSELRIDHGPGYRIYFKQVDKTITILPSGGDKDSQAKDIAAAKVLAKEWSE